ncbi:MAG: ABC transporter ATP-binding protein [Gammaproteobacteria bacterium]
MSETLLEVRDLAVEFSSREGTVHAVNGISYRVGKGEILGIVGESGSGKTVSVLSLLRLLPGNGRITRGEILFEGRDLLELPSQEIRRIRGNRISMIFQDPMSSMNPVLRVARQIKEALVVHLGMSDRAAVENVVGLLQKVGIPSARERVNDYPHQFSGGMRQRAMIAMGLSCSPDLLIADEPTTALDVTVQAQIIDLVQSLRTELGMSIIWITHDLGVLAGLADRVIVMYAGTIVEEASVDDIFSAPAHPYTRGLIGSIPRLDGVRREKLEMIEGAPADLIQYPPGCPFSDRCRYVGEGCVDEMPVARELGGAHQVACHYPIE